MQSYEAIIIELENEAESYSDGSYLSTLCLESSTAIRSLIQEAENMERDIAKLKSRIRMNRNKARD